MSENRTETDLEKKYCSYNSARTLDSERSAIILGFSGYFKRFIKDYAKIAKPLNDMLLVITLVFLSKVKKKEKEEEFNSLDIGSCATNCI